VSSSLTRKDATKVYHLTATLDISIPTIYADAMTSADRRICIQHGAVTRTRLPETVAACAMAEASSEPDARILIAANKVNWLRSWIEDNLSYIETAKRRGSRFVFENGAEIWVLSYKQFDPDDPPFAMLDSAYLLDCARVDDIAKDTIDRLTSGQLCYCGEIAEKEHWFHESCHGGHTTFNVPASSIANRFTDVGDELDELKLLFSDTEQARYLELQDITATRARGGPFKKFFKQYAPARPYVFGTHTNRLIKECQKTTEMLEAGKSRFVCVCLPFRHGKSDIFERRYPSWHLARNPTNEIILASYSFTLAKKMSYDARAAFKRSYADHNLSMGVGKGGIGSWGPDGYKGVVHSAGLGGSITGMGADLMLIGDYYKNRAEAESEKIRAKVQHSFESDLMTRLADVAAVMIVANRWHVNDLVGWIVKKNDPDSEIYDKDFPKFEIIKIPAQDEKGKWLFPERFSDEWYRNKRALMSEYAWQAQGMQDPRPRIGNLLKIDKLTVVSVKKWKQMTEGFPWRRGWDVASSEKERLSDDPDRTAGTKACYVNENIYVDDIVVGTWEAPQRNRIIKTIAIGDGPNVPAWFEVVAGYKDLYTQMGQLLGEINTPVYPYYPSGKGDKVARASVMEAPFETGRVFIKEAEWNAQWKTRIAEFPSGKKDEVDSLVIAINDQISLAGQMEVDW